MQKKSEQTQGILLTVLPYQWKRAHTSIHTFREDREWSMGLLNQCADLTESPEMT